MFEVQALKSKKDDLKLSKEKVSDIELTKIQNMRSRLKDVKNDVEN